MSRFGADEQAFFATIYKEKAPWDIGGPQPALVELLSEHLPIGPVLDVGCGSGGLSLFLAEEGHEVTGIDFVAAAIDLAQSKARELSPDVEARLTFRVADGLRPSLLQEQFGSVVDSGFYHLFDLEEGDRYIDELAKMLRPKGLFYLLAFAVDFQVPNVPRSISEEEIRARFTSKSGWEIKTLRPAEFHSRVAPPVPAITACIERVYG